LNLPSLSPKYVIVRGVHFGDGALGGGQTWKKFLAFWASELGSQNPSADFLWNIRYKEEIMKICNHYSIIQKEFLLPAAGTLL
jgi:hypothetical protein